jgi:hypothetical protein
VVKEKFSGAIPLIFIPPKIRWGHAALSPEVWAKPMEKNEFPVLLG